MVKDPGVYEPRWYDELIVTTVKRGSQIFVGMKIWLYVIAKTSAATIGVGCIVGGIAALCWMIIYDRLLQIKKEDGYRALPDHLDKRLHWDFFWPLKLIPRWLTSWNWGVPKMVWGNQTTYRNDGKTYKLGPGPIGEPGSWQISRYPDLMFPFNLVPVYFALTTKSGYHFRIGARWDDVDSYITFPTIALRKPKAYRGIG